MPKNIDLQERKGKRVRERGESESERTNPINIYVLWAHKQSHVILPRFYTIFVFPFITSGKYEQYFLAAYKYTYTSSSIVIVLLACGRSILWIEKWSAHNSGSIRSRFGFPFEPNQTERKIPYRWKTFAFNLASFQFHRWPFFTGFFEFPGQMVFFTRHNHKTINR